MGIKTYNPYTPSRRNMTGSDFSEITKSTPEKSLLAKKSKNAGRNNQGKITVRHHGGGNRQKYRIIDFKRNKEGVPAQVIGIEYDPNRTANIALICYADGEKAYILAPQGLTDGMTVQNGAGAEVRVGNCLPLSEIPVGTQVHNIELYPGKGGQLVRSAGNSAQLMAKEGKYEMIKEEELDPLARDFQENVKENRGNKLKLDAAGLLRGRMFYAKEAITVGLADAVGTVDFAIRRAKEIPQEACINEYINSKS